jgi:hypothetical protein
MSSVLESSKETDIQREEAAPDGASWPIESDATRENYPEDAVHVETGSLRASIAEMEISPEQEALPAETSFASGAQYRDRN